MDELSFQHVFSRVYSYLGEAGIEMTGGPCRQMLRLIDDALADESCGNIKPGQYLLENVMSRLPEYFTIPERSTPLNAPPLCRGSIGYSGHGSREN